MIDGWVEILLVFPLMVRQAHHEREQQTVRPELVEGQTGRSWFGNPRVSGRVSTEP
jgi:hypothetical protein